METSTISKVQTPQPEDPAAKKRSKKKAGTQADGSAGFAQALSGVGLPPQHAFNVQLHHKQQNVEGHVKAAEAEPALKRENGRLGMASKLEAKMEAKMPESVPGGISHFAGRPSQARLFGTAVESMPLTQKSAVSLNTAHQVAGLKPWARDWVFNGDEEQNPNLKTLLEKNPGIKGGEGGASELQKVRRIEAELATAMKNAAALHPHASTEQLEQAAVAEVAKAHGAEVQGLQAQLSKLGGQVQHTRRQDLMAQPGQPVQGLSGAEFMSALSGIRNPGQGHGQNLGQNPGEERGSWRGGGEALGNPELGAIHGDKKDKFTLGQQLQVQLPIHHLDQNPSTLAKSLVPAEITGRVVKGSMARDRLTTESLLGMTNTIRSMNARGGGQMVVRLNPANLGQLSVKVATNGRDVALDIQASDHKAKEILEHSLSSLKDSLAGQQLTLARVDVSVVGSNHAQHSGDGWQQGQQHAGAGDLLGNFRQDGGQGGGGRGQWSGSAPSDESGYRSSSVPRSGLSSMSGLMAGRSGGSSGAYARAGGGLSRLDVMA